MPLNEKMFKHNLLKHSHGIAAWTGNVAIQIIRKLNTQSALLVTPVQLFISISVEQSHGRAETRCNKAPDHGEGNKLDVEWSLRMTKRGI